MTPLASQRPQARPLIFASGPVKVGSYARRYKARYMAWGRNRFLTVWFLRYSVIVQRLHSHPLTRAVRPTGTGVTICGFRFGGYHGLSTHTAIRVRSSYGLLHGTTSWDYTSWDYFMGLRPPAPSVRMFAESERTSATTTRQTARACRTRHGARHHRPTQGLVHRCSR